MCVRVSQPYHILQGGGNTRLLGWTSRWPGCVLQACPAMRAHAHAHTHTINNQVTADFNQFHFHPFTITCKFVQEEELLPMGWNNRNFLLVGLKTTGAFYQLVLKQHNLPVVLSDNRGFLLVGLRTTGSFLLFDRSDYAMCVWSNVCNVMTWRNQVHKSVTWTNLQGGETT